MITELIVTSAPRGLQAGRSGFTTVMRTRGIHPDLAIRLESASGYRHTYPQGDPRNPIIYSYTNTPSAAGEAWVLSRVGDAGTDYTGRSNKIAHHIALKPEDVGRLTASNPALVLSALAGSGGFKTVWQGEPAETPAPPALPTPTSQPEVCQRWKSAAGDPGWAGVLVERALNKETTWVIAPAGTDILGLFAEALALAGPAQRWQIPFTTYSLNRNEGRWLGTLAGTPEADAARKQPRALVVDLANPGLPPSAGPYVQAARGLAPPPWAKTARVQDRQPVAQQSVTVPQTYASSGHSIATTARPDVSPPPILMQSGVPPVLKQWPGSIPEPSRPWYASPMLFCVTGGAVLLGAGTIGYRSLTSSRRSPPETPKTHVAQPLDSVDDVASDDTNTRRAVADQPASQPQAEESSASTHSLAAGASSIAEPDHGSLNNHPVEAKPDIALFDRIAEAAATHAALETLPLRDGPLTGEPVTVVKWEGTATDALTGVTLTLPAVGAEKTAHYHLKSSDAPDARESQSPEVQWKCTQGGDHSQDVGMFVVNPKKITFIPSSDGYVTASSISLRPLVFQHTRRLDQMTWVELRMPTKVSVVTGENAGSQTRLFQVDSSEEGEVLADAIRQAGITLHFPDGIVVQPAHSGRDVGFANEISWPEKSRGRRFRWRPKSWDDAAGAWLQGELAVDTSWANGWVMLETRLQFEHAECIDLGPLAFSEHKNFRASLVNGTPLAMDKFKVVGTSAVGNRSTVASETITNEERIARRRAAKQQLPAWFGKLEECVKAGDPKVLADLSVTVDSYSADDKENRSRSAKEWIDHLRTYLVAYRVCEATRHHQRPDETVPVGDDKVRQHEEEWTAWRSFIDEVRGTIKPTDRDAFHRWCEEVVSLDSQEPIEIAELARLWMQLAAFAEDIRAKSASKTLAVRMRPRLSGQLQLEWKGVVTPITTTPVILEPGPGEFLSMPVATAVEASPSGQSEGNGTVVDPDADLAPEPEPSDVREDAVVDKALSDKQGAGDGSNDAHQRN